MWRGNTSLHTSENDLYMTFTKPMLAASLLPSNAEHTDQNILEAMSKLKYPVLATLKKDGIRAIKLGELASRTLKRIPNLSIQKRSEKLPYYLDMELWNPALSYDEVESIVMSREHPDTDKIQFHLLDLVSDTKNYLHRCLIIQEDYALHIKYEDIKWTSPILCHNAQALFGVFLTCEQQEGEGICFRTPDSPYKQGRSTLREQYLVKLSRYLRTEVKIIGFTEQLANTNPEKRSPVGMMARRKTVGNSVPKNTLGAFLCELPNGDKIDVGTGVGLTDALRKEIWLNRDCYFGKQITVKHKPIGQKNKLRHPIFVGFRTEGF